MAEETAVANATNEKIVETDTTNLNLANLPVSKDAEGNKVALLLDDQGNKIAEFSKVYISGNVGGKYTDKQGPFTITDQKVSEAQYPYVPVNPEKYGNPDAMKNPTFDWSIGVKKWVDQNAESQGAQINKLNDALSKVDDALKQVKDVQEKDQEIQSGLQTQSVQIQQMMGQFGQVVNTLPQQLVALTQQVAGLSQTVNELQAAQKPAETKPAETATDQQSDAKPAEKPAETASTTETTENK